MNDDDYLMEVTVQVAVRKQDVAALLSLSSEPYSDDSDEEERVFDAVSQVIDGSVEDHKYLHYSASSICRMPSFRLFDNL